MSELVNVYFSLRALPRCSTSQSQEALVLRVRRLRHDETIEEFASSPVLRGNDSFVDFPPLRIPQATSDRCLDVQVALGNKPQPHWCAALCRIITGNMLRIAGCEVMETSAEMSGTKLSFAFYPVTRPLMEFLWRATFPTPPLPVAAVGGAPMYALELRLMPPSMHDDVDAKEEVLWVWGPTSAAEGSKREFVFRGKAPVPICDATYLVKLRPWVELPLSGGGGSSPLESLTSEVMGPPIARYVWRTRTAGGDPSLVMRIDGNVDLELVRVAPPAPPRPSPPPTPVVNVPPPVVATSRTTARPSTPPLPDDWLRVHQSSSSPPPPQSPPPQVTSQVERTLSPHRDSVGIPPVVFTNATPFALSQGYGLGRQAAPGISPRNTLASASAFNVRPLPPSSPSSRAPSSPPSSSHNAVAEYIGVGPRSPLPPPRLPITSLNTIPRDYDPFVNRARTVDGILAAIDAIHDDLIKVSLDAAMDPLQYDAAVQQLEFGKGLIGSALQRLGEALEKERNA